MDRKSCQKDITGQKTVPILFLKIVKFIFFQNFEIHNTFGKLTARTEVSLSNDTRKP